MMNKAITARGDGVTITGADDIQTIKHALEVAAARFREDEKVANEAGHTRIAQQFEQQAIDSLVLVGNLEELGF